VQKNAPSGAFFCLSAGIYYIKEVASCSAEVFAGSGCTTFHLKRTRSKSLAQACEIIFGVGTDYLFDSSFREIWQCK
jgi:hypothetical protein